MDDDGTRLALEPTPILTGWSYPRFFFVEIRSLCCVCGPQSIRCIVMSVLMAFRIAICSTSAWKLHTYALKVSDLVETRRLSKRHEPGVSRVERSSHREAATHQFGPNAEDERAAAGTATRDFGIAAVAAWIAPQRGKKTLWIHECPAIRLTPTGKKTHDGQRRNPVGP